MSQRKLWLLLFPAGGLLSAAAWRAEIELHGWPGLDWLHWFHWAVPLALLLFIASGLATARAARPQPSWLRVGVAAVVLVLFAAAADVFTGIGLELAFSRLAMLIEPWRRYALMSIPVAMPALLALVLLPLGLWPGFLRLGAAWALWIATMPLMTAGGTDFVEVIKRGWPVPLLYVALGLLFWPGRPKA